MMACQPCLLLNATKTAACLGTKTIAATHHFKDFGRPVSQLGAEEQRIETPPPGRYPAEFGVYT